MMTVIGTRNTHFTASDTGKEISGKNFYVTYQLDGCSGLACERIFLTDDKLCTFPFVPQVGDQVSPTYNRYGKVELFMKVDKPVPEAFPNEKVGK